VLTLYYAPGACSLAPHIMLEEVGAAFDTVRLSLADGDHKRPEYLALSPLGRVPTLVDDGFPITETPAILSYLGHRFAETGLLPLNDLRSLAHCEQLLSFFSSSVHVAVAQIWRAERYVEDSAAFEAVRAGGRRNLRQYFAMIETMLDDNDWLVGGRYTVADITPLIFYRWGLRMGEAMAAYPAWTRHASRIIERPAVQHAIATEGLKPQEFQPPPPSTASAA
jgi:glutathione S-transferase